MKRWVIFDDCNTEIFETVLDTDDINEATNEAKFEWFERMTPSDRKRRLDFYIGLADVDEDGIVDYDSVSETVCISCM